MPPVEWNKSGRLAVNAFPTDFARKDIPRYMSSFSRETETRRVFKR